MNAFDHNIPLLALAMGLSAACALVGAQAFARSRAAHGRRALTWLFTGATMVALAIWVLHLMAMLAMDIGAPVRFEPGHLAWSAAIMLAGAWAGYLMMRRTRTLAHVLGGGMIIVTASVLTHHVAMLGFETPAQMTLDPRMLAAAWAAGVVLTCAASILYRRAPALRPLVTPAGVVLGTVAIHFIGMAAASLTPDPAAAQDASGLSKPVLAGVIAAITFAAAAGTAVVVAFDLMLAARQRRAQLRIAALSEELKKARADAELARRAKSEFLGAMSHELRTPLNGVVGMGAVLAQSDLRPDQKQMLEIMEDSAKSLERVISDVLDLSQADSGDLKIKPAPFCPFELTEACVALYGDAARRGNLTLRTEFDPALRRSYLGDARRIRQVLGNLVSNAVKFTEKGGVTVGVSAQASDTHPDRAALCFSVRDTGIGVALADHPKIFQAFRQADNTNARRYGGTGLGLAIADHIARLMGGRITLESAPGKGSIFRFQVAVSVAEESAAAPQEALQGWSLSSRMSVLVLENDPAEQVKLRGMLDRLGASAAMAETLEDAQALMAAQRFDLIIYDAAIQVKGAEAELRRLRRSQPAGAAAPILVCTSRAAAHQKSDYLRSGADRVLEKPLDVEEFFETVEELCEADNTLSLLNEARTGTA